MTKFFDKKIADEIGNGAATHLAAMAADLQADLERMAAMRKAEGRPTFEEEEAADRAETLAMMAEGYRFDPDVEAWARGE
jgi:hypothetical protein